MNDQVEARTHSLLLRRAIKTAKPRKVTALVTLLGFVGGGERPRWSLRLLTVRQACRGAVRPRPILGPSCPSPRGRLGARTPDAGQTARSAREPSAASEVPRSGPTQLRFSP